MITQVRKFKTVRSRDNAKEGRVHRVVRDPWTEELYIKCRGFGRDWPKGEMVDGWTETTCRRCNGTGHRGKGAK